MSRGALSPFPHLLSLSLRSNQLISIDNIFRYCPRLLLLDSSENFLLDEPKNLYQLLSLNISNNSIKSISKISSIFLSKVRILSLISSFTFGQTFFWRKLLFLGKLLFLAKTFISGQNFYFWSKLLCLAKTFVFGRKFHFWSKLLFLVETFVFGQNFYYYFVAKNLIFGQNFYFLAKTFTNKIQRFTRN